MSKNTTITPLAKPIKTFKIKAMVFRAMKERKIFNMYSEEDLMTQKWLDRLMSRYKYAKRLESKHGKDSVNEECRQLLDKYTILQTGKKKVLVEQTSCQTKPSKPNIKYLISFDEAIIYLKSAHITTYHGDATAMKREMKTLIKHDFVVSPLCYKLFFDLEVCLKCKSRQLLLSKEPTQYTNETNNTENNFACTATIDILTLTKDNNFNHLLIVRYMDIDFVQLRPLTTDGSNELFTEIFKIFMDFYLPEYIAIGPTVDQDIYLEIQKRLSSSTNSKVELRTYVSIDGIKHIVHSKIMEWMKTECVDSWAVGCNFVQLEMNNTPNEEGVTPSSKMFNNTVMTNMLAETSDITTKGNETCLQNISTDPGQANLETLPTDADKNTYIQNIPIDSVITTLNGDKIKLHNIILIEEDNENNTLSKKVVKTTEKPSMPVVEVDTKPICSQCGSLIRTKVYICHKCKGKLHLYCSTQTRDESDQSVVISICLKCQKNK